MRQAILAAEHNGAAFMDGKQLESAREIMAESGIDGLRVVFRFQSSFIDANQLFSFPRFFPETIIRNPIKPSKFQITEQGRVSFWRPFRLTIAQRFNAGS